MHAMTTLRSTPWVCALAALLVSGRAWGAPSRFELEPKLGYAAAFTTGLSPYGPFVGLGLGARLIGHLWLRTSVSSHVGSSAAANGPNVVYRAHDRAHALALDASWRFDAGPLFIEPGIEVGALWVLGSTYVTPTQVSDHYVIGDLGLVLRVGVRVGRLAIGVEGAGLFVPSAVAAPVVRGAAWVALPF